MKRNYFPVPSVCYIYLEIMFTQWSSLQATETLRGSLAQLKERYNSGIKSLDDIAVTLDKDSQTTLNDLNSEVTKHSCALEDVRRESLKHVVNFFDIDFFDLMNLC